MSRPARDGASPSGLRALLAEGALAAAPQVLNLVLVNGACAGRIVEVEAYEGGDDPASHAYRGETARNRTMFGPPGHLYVYLSYGMHHCANLVCGPPGRASALLLRALEPLTGVEEMRRGRPPSLPDATLCSGPGRLCRSLGIDRGDDGSDLLARPGAPDRVLALLDDGFPPPPEPHRGRRVGLSERCGDALVWQWRFAVPGNRAVSRPRPGERGAEQLPRGAEPTV